MTSKESPSLRKRWLIGDGIGLVVLLGSAYAAAYLLAGDKILVSTTVKGVVVGGPYPADVEQRLCVELGARYEAVLTVTDGKEYSVELTSLGSDLSADYTDTVKVVGRTSLNPVDVFKTLLGGGPTELPKNIDSEKPKGTLTTHAPTFQVKGIDVTLALVNGTISRIESIDSMVLDVDTTSASVVEAMKLSTCEVAAATKTQALAVTSAMVDEAVANFVTPVFSGPVTMKVHDKSFQVSPKQIASIITFAAEDGKLVPHINSKQLLKVIAEAHAGLGLVTGKSVGYTLKGDTIEVVLAEDGQQLDMKGLTEGAAKAAAQSGEVWATTIGVIDGSAEFSAERVESPKPTQVVGKPTTYYPHADHRDKNLERVAEFINGKVLLPGETFSLNDALGSRTPANGFTDGYVINGGLLVEEFGGSISQAATTMYNAGFLASYGDVKHRSHTLYFDHHPTGREAIIYCSSFDMEFKNSTDYPTHIQDLNIPSTADSEGSLTFRT